MGIIDIIFLCIIALGFISGLQKGLLASFAACIAMAGAWFIAAANYGRLVAILAGSKLEIWLTSFEVTDQATVNSIFGCVSFVLIFLAAFAALLLVVNLLNNVLRFPQLRVFDGILGGILGIARALVLLVVVIGAVRLIFKPLNTDIVENLLNGSIIGNAISGIDILGTVLK